MNSTREQIETMNNIGLNEWYDEIIYYIEDMIADDLATDEMIYIYKEYCKYGYIDTTTNTYQEIIEEINTIIQNGYK